MNERGARRRQILEVLATALETKPGARVSTAALARAVGVSEAALYRHFPSKTRMFEALIEFAEEIVFGAFNQVMSEQREAATRCQHLAFALLRFAERNPGITRILTGEILAGEHQRLRARVQQFHARVETQFRQALREAGVVGGVAPAGDAIAQRAALLMAVVDGRLAEYVRSDFRLRPTRDWDAYWYLLEGGLFSR